MENIEKRIKQITLIIVIILWVAVIFSFSLHSGTASHLQSRTVKESIKAILLALHIPIYRGIYDIFRPFALPGEVVNGEYFVRKLAHSFEYGIIGIIISLFYKSQKGIGNTTKHYNPFLYLGGPATALIDEGIIQKYIVTQRTSSYKDVILDTIAFSIGFFIISTLYEIKLRK